MSDHLPECPVSLPRGNSNDLCICDQLRACEQRVLAEQTSKRNSPGGWMDYGYAAGAQAAYDAVAALNPLCSGLCECLPDALAAIDALRGEA